MVNYTRIMGYMASNGSCMRVLCRMCAALAAGMAVLAASAAPDRPDVLFVLIDSLKASHVGCYGYARDTTPSLDRFAAAEAVRFETVIPGGSWTQPAVMTLFTSLPADEHMRVLPNVPHNPAAVTLAEALRDAGYETVGITANTMTNRRYGYAKGFDLWDDYSVTVPPDAGLERISTGYAKGSVLTRSGLARLKRRNPDKPLFLFLFYMDPHWDFNPPPPYDMKFSSTGLGPLKGAWRIGANKATPEIRRRTVDAYDGEIAYCDNVVSNLLAEIARTSRWDNTLVVVMGDHGESFWERGFTGHGNHLHDEELKVPLMIRVPAGAARIRPGTVVRGQVGGIDVAPTILDLAGVPPPSSWKGRSLRGAMESGESGGRPVVTETRIRAGLWQRGVRTDRYKVVAVGDFDAPSEAYDLVADPGETNNLVRTGVPLPPGAAALVPLLKPTRRKGSEAMKTLASTLVLLALSSELSAAVPRTPFAAWDDVENPASLTNGLAMPPAFTAIAWFEAGSFADFAPVLTYTTDFSSWTNGFGIFTMADGSLAAYVRSMDEPGLVAEGVRTGEPCHVALVYSGAKATLYVDGAPKASTSFAASVSLDCGGALWAGTPPGSHASPPFDGAFAGVRLYPSALDWTSIASEFSAAKLAHLNDLGQDSSLFDYDGDGMPDEWELRFGLNPCNPADASLDPDGDGVSNRDEFLRGRSPRARAVAAAPSLLKSCTVTAP